ncbi:MAG TPA: ABC transporter substrate-binding protein [Rhizomicrobium sp.]|nr:ABC transporter substrate-binding protein [Rhizomicrobium sp.]
MKLIRHAIALISLLATGSADADDKTLYLGGSGGSIEQAFRATILPNFEKMTGWKVEYVTGNSTDLLARLQAQRANEQMDVVFLDDGPMAQAVELGLCRSLAPALIYDDLYDLAKSKDGKSVFMSMVGTGIMYNAKYFADHQWAPPDSWSDLKDPKYKGKLVIPPISNSFGLIALVAEAKLAGGSESNIDPGFAAFEKEVGPNVLAYEPAPGKMSELFQSGQTVIGVWGSSRAKVLADTGFPASFTYPREGGYAIGIAVCAVAGGKDRPEAQTLIQHMLASESQRALAIAGSLGPVNQKTVLRPEERAGIPYGDRVLALKTLDWTTINKNREVWTARWSREIER